MEKICTILCDWALCDYSRMVYIRVLLLSLCSFWHRSLWWWSMYSYLHIYIYIYICKYIFIYLFTYIYIYIDMCKYMYIYIFICMYFFMQIYIYLYIHLFIYDSDLYPSMLYFASTVTGPLTEQQIAFSCTEMLKVLVSLLICSLLPTQHKLIFFILFTIHLLRICFTA